MLQLKFLNLYNKLVFYFQKFHDLTNHLYKVQNNLDLYFSHQTIPQDLLFHNHSSYTILNPTYKLPVWKNFQTKSSTRNKFINTFSIHHHISD